MELIVEYWTLICNVGHYPLEQHFSIFLKSKAFFKAKQSHFFPRKCFIIFHFFSPAINALMFRTQKEPSKSATIDFNNIFLLQRGIQMCKLVSKGRKPSLMSHPIRSRDANIYK